MSAEEAREAVSCYEGFDFRRQWRGREAVTRLESRVVRNALADAGGGRILEAGTGFGRLSAVVAELATEYVGADLDPSQLDSVRDQVRTVRPSGPALLAHANVYHLPFAAGSFSGLVSIRVYHHIREPSAFLAEAARVIAPGGTLVLGYTPKPSMATLGYDVRTFLEGHPAGLTTDRTEVREFGRGPFPVVVATRARVRRDVAAAGFELVREYGQSPEQLARWLPIGTSERLASVFPGTFLLPTRVLVARRPGPAVPAVPPLEEILACPLCHARLAPADLRAESTLLCASCGFRAELAGGVLRAAFVPPGAPRHSVAVSTSGGAPPVAPTARAAPLAAPNR
jgi:SAM-dependent methyltransferase